MTPKDKVRMLRMLERECAETFARMGRDGINAMQAGRDFAAEHAPRLAAWTTAAILALQSGQRVLPLSLSGWTDGEVGAGLAAALFIDRTTYPCDERLLPLIEDFGDTLLRLFTFHAAARLQQRDIARSN